MKGGISISKYQEYVNQIDSILRPELSYDIIRRYLPLKNNTSSMLYYIDGFLQGDTMVWLFQFFLETDNPLSLIDTIPYVEVEHTSDIDIIITKVLSGATAFVIDGLDDVILVYSRKYPTRGVEEPENEKVLRGPRDGFSENVVTNTALIRRRIRDPNLIMSAISLGDSTKTNVVISYIQGRADEKLVDKIKNKLLNTELKALSFGEQSLAEVLVQTRWYNPFPKVRYTERPDSASAMLLEGSVVLVCDNSPAVIILPVSIFDFVQEADDFYLPPLTATYFRFVRLIIMFTTLFFLPLWYLVIKNPEFIPPYLEFIKVAKYGAVPIFLQIILVEVIVDGLKMASINTPSVLSSSLNVVAGLILGDMAVKVGWFIPEVILYLAFITIANFTQPSYELGYALKFMRIIILVLTTVFNIWGFVAGVLLVCLLIVSNRTVDGNRGYLYPLIPWNARAMKRFFVRVKLK